MTFAFFCDQKLEEIRINTEDKDCTQGNGVEDGLNKTKTKPRKENYE